VQGIGRGRADGYTEAYHRGAPVGDLRWRALSRRLSGMCEGNRKVRARLHPGHDDGQAAAAPAPSEDCLYLNIWSRQKSPRDACLFLCGSMAADSPWAQLPNPRIAERSSRKGSDAGGIAYRVGQNGILRAPGVSAETKNHVSGNYGLLDMIAGLPMDSEKHCRIRRRSSQGNHLWRVGWRNRRQHVVRIALAKGLFNGAISESGGSFGTSRPAPLPERT